MITIQRLLKHPWLPENINKSAYAWLTMLAFFYWKYIAGGGDSAEILLAVASTALFLAMYFTHYWVTGRAVRLIIAGMTMMGLVWAPYNFGASTFIIFSAACCARLPTARQGYIGVILTVATTMLLSYVQSLPADFWVPTLIVSATIGVASVMQNTLRRSQQSLLRSQEQVAYLATLAERERISRDMHDLLGHTLTMITIKAELAGKLISRDIDAAKTEISDIESTARQALSEVRSAISGYRSVGINQELVNAENGLNAANIELNKQIASVTLSPQAEQVLSLAVREAVTNVMRHSNASRCDITLDQQNNWVVLDIRDNGQASANHPPIRHGNGLTGMSERVISLGGQLAVDTRTGFALQIRLPADQPGVSLG